MAARLSSAEAKRRVVVAARALAGESGMSALTIDAVAARSGVAKTTIYRSWPTIEELRIETVGSLVAEMPTPNTGTLLGDLEEIAERFAATAQGGMRALMLSVLEAESRDPRLTKIRQDLMAAATDPLSAAISAAIERGEVAEGTDVELASDLVRGPMFVRLVIECRPTTDEQRTNLLRASLAAIRELGAEDD